MAAFITAARVYLEPILSTLFSKMSFRNMQPILQEWLLIEDTVVVLRNMNLRLVKKLINTEI